MCVTARRRFRELRLLPSPCAGILSGVRPEMLTENADRSRSPAACGPDGTNPVGDDIGTGRQSEPNVGPNPGLNPGVEPTLPVAAVARRVGVAPATLRTWDRRYGLGPSRHTDGKQRRYAPDDLARLEVMQPCPATRCVDGGGRLLRPRHRRCFRADRRGSHPVPGMSRSLVAAK